MINRSSTPSLLRGGKKTTSRKRTPDLVSDFAKKSGSLTHKSLTTEPSLRALGARKSQIEYGLPHKGVRPSRKDDASLRENAHLVKTRKAPKRFDYPFEFGPNEDHSARAGDHYKRGGRAAGGHWIQDAIKKPGSLRKSLHVKPGAKIPAAKLEKATHSRNPLTRKRANLAETLRGFHH